MNCLKKTEIQELFRPYQILWRQVKGNWRKMIQTNLNPNISITILYQISCLPEETWEREWERNREREMLRGRRKRKTNKVLVGELNGFAIFCQYQMTFPAFNEDLKARYILLLCKYLRFLWQYIFLEIARNSFFRRLSLMKSKPNDDVWCIYGSSLRNNP